MASRLVLLAHLDRSTQGTLSGAFAEGGFSSLVAASAEESIALAATNELSLAILDVSPDAGGTSALRSAPALRASRGGPLVLVMSSVVDESVARGAIEAGAAHFFETPVVPKEVVRVGVKLLSDRIDFITHVETTFASAGLTEREAAVAKLVLKGLNNQEIARVSGVSEKAVRTQITCIYEKCGVASRSELFFFMFPS